MSTCGRGKVSRNVSQGVSWGRRAGGDVEGRRVYWQGGREGGRKGVSPAVDRRLATPKPTCAPSQRSDPTFLRLLRLTNICRHQHLFWGQLYQLSVCL